VKKPGVLLLLTLILAALHAPGANAQDPSQVGLVVRFGDGSILTRCVSFAGDEVTGDEVLAQSGLTVVLSATSGQGTLVCKIEDEGCPAEDCWCQCKGQSCAYWSYWRLIEGTWSYSPVGVSMFKSRSGDVQGWSWGNQEPPPDLTFEQICAAPTATPTVAQTAIATRTYGPTATRVPTRVQDATTAMQTAAPTSASPTTTQPATPTQTTTLTPSPTPTEDPPAPTGDGGSPRANYASFGLMLIVQAVVLVIVLRRRQ
jgi:hypothetical protein